MDSESHAVTPNVPSTRGTTWSEPALWPPSSVLIKLDISIDGPAGFGTVAVVVTNGDDMELAAMECAPVVQYDALLSISVEMLAKQIASALSVISPF